MMFVEVTLLFPNSIRIRGRNASFVVDPQESMKKTNADGVVFLSAEKEDTGVLRVEDARVVIKGAGEYEVGGVRILGAKAGAGFIYSFYLDNLGIFLGKTSAIDKVQGTKDYNLLILDADAAINPSSVTPFEPNVVVLYGQKAREQAQNLGGQKVTYLSKFSVSSEKLPGETEVVVLWQK